ncbi:MAG: hypothetical protein ACPG32_03610 [Akkermansiaceae bacterium]
MKILVKILPFVLIIGAVIGWKAYNKHKFSSELKEGIEKSGFLTSVPGVDEEYTQELLDHAHPIALDKAYNMGGRRKGADFDDRAYKTELFKEMAKKARDDGETAAAAYCLLRAQH